MHRYSRHVVVALAVASFAGAFALTPSEVRSRFAPPSNASRAAAVRHDAPLALVVPSGDPFEPRAVDDDGAPVPARGPAALPFLAPGRLGALPPNAGAGLTPLDFASIPSARVTAIVVGQRSSALVIDGAATHLVAAGDRVAGATVTAIDANGLTLDDGRHLLLPARTENRR